MWKARSIVAGDSRREPSRPLALARILVASAALIQMPATREHLARLLAPGTFRAPYVFSPSVGAAWGTGLVWLMVALAAAAMVGWHARIALGGLALAIAFLLALDQQLYRSDLYLLLLECGLLSLAASGAALSLDARRGGKDFVEGWPVLLLKLQLSIVYASTAIQKLNPTFLRGGMLQGSLRFAIPSKLAVALSLAVIVTECFLAVGLWLRITRRPAMLVGVLLHSSFLFMLVLGPLLVAFGFEMLSLYLLFLRIAPDEYAVVYDCRLPFIRASVRWCRRLDWLQACRLDPYPGFAPVELEVAHGSMRFSGFEALREIAHILPATCFLAPLLSLPGVAGLGSRVYRSLVARADARVRAA
jgi:hypothetical protein